MKNPETVLVVDDEITVRTIISRVLQLRGYHVLSAASAEEALPLCATHPGPIRLAIIDLTLPGELSGPELALALSQRDDGLAVIFISGEVAEADLTIAGLKPAAIFLQKPFTIEILAEVVGQITAGVTVSDPAVAAPEW